jgi:flavin reductase (DIM6/NTAB) family NADH-FMN oxidoreductase RutF
MTKPQPLRTVLERFPYGVFVVAASPAEGDLIAIVATWIMQVSFVPPLIAVALEKDGDLAKALGRDRRFTVSLVPEHGIPIAQEVLKAGPRISGPRAQAIFSGATTGAPKLLGSAGVLGCRVCDLHDSGDHLLVIAVIEDCESPHGVEILSLKQTGWKYRKKDSGTTV